MAVASLAAPPEPTSPRRSTPIDTRVRLITPERVTYTYPVAGPFRRAVAYLLDLLVYCVVLLVAILAASAFGAYTATEGGLASVLVFVFFWGYAATWEATCNGQTPGKRMMGLRVVSADGTPITGAQAFLRSLAWWVEGPLTLFFMPALASMILAPHFRRLGDLAAGTMVIVEARPQRGRLIALQRDDNEARAVLALLPARVETGTDLARALADYMARRPRFAVAQREEITAPLARPLRARYGLDDRHRGDAVVAAVYVRAFLSGDGTDT